MSWHIMPGEDIAETVRLIYPHDAFARDKLLRAIIRINPEHFPQEINRSLTAGTIIQFPDLRTIGAHTKKAVNKRERPVATQQTSPRNSQQNAIETVSSVQNKSVITQFIAQLENAAANELHELAVLKDHIAALELLLEQFQLPQSSTESISERNEDSSPQIIAGDATAEGVSSAADLKSDTGVVTEPTEPATILDNNEMPQQSIETAEPESFLMPESAPVSTPSLSVEPAAEVFVMDDETLLMLGVLLALLIVLVLLRSYRGIKQRFTKSSESTAANKNVREQYEALLLHRKEEVSESKQTELLLDPSNKIMDEVNSHIEQNNDIAAIELLQKQLATNQNDIKGWLKLFELLYKTNNKRDFKKNARRFKRMKVFPEIWVQIQELGVRLEPNESLYFNEQKRKEKFFSEASDSIH